MSAPETMSALPVPARPLLPDSRPSVPARRNLGALVRQAALGIRVAGAILAAGLAAEYALRTVANRTLAAAGHSSTRVVPSPQPVGGGMTRIVVTEFVVHERSRHHR